MDKKTIILLVSLVLVGLFLSEINEITGEVSSFITGQVAYFGDTFEKNCADGIDNDNDGKIDSQDYPDCNPKLRAACIPLYEYRNKQYCNLCGWNAYSTSSSLSGYKKQGIVGYVYSERYLYNNKNSKSVPLYQHVQLCEGCYHFYYTRASYWPNYVKQKKVGYVMKKKVPNRNIPLYEYYVYCKNCPSFSYSTFPISGRIKSSNPVAYIFPTFAKCVCEYQNIYEETDCNDNLDNDCDGKIDSEDSDCSRTTIEVHSNSPYTELAYIYKPGISEPLEHLNVKEGQPTTFTTILEAGKTYRVSIGHSIHMGTSGCNYDITLQPGNNIVKACTNFGSYQTHTDCVADCNEKNSVIDPLEGGACFDDKDNDFDNLIDCDDPDCSVLTACQLETPTQTECTDSDGGKNYYIKGTVLDTTHGFTRTYVDKCGVVVDGVNMPNRLIEHFCGPSGWQHIEYDCPNGCLNGACKKEVVLTEEEIPYSPPTPIPIEEEQVTPIPVPTPIEEEPAISTPTPVVEPVIPIEEEPIVEIQTTARCKDSDGINLGIKGYCIEPRGDRIDDVCSGKTRIKEAFCDSSNNCNLKTYTCPANYKCSNGACIKKVQEIPEPEVPETPTAGEPRPIPPDVDLFTVTIDYVDDAPLDDSGYPGMSASEPAIYIHTPRINIFNLNGKLTSEIWIAMLNNKYKIFYKDIESVPDIIYFGEVLIGTKIIYKDTSLGLHLVPQQDDPTKTAIIVKESNGHLKAIFGIKNGKINCLGKVCSLAEIDELSFIDNSIPSSTNIGTRTTDFYTNYGIIIRKPAARGAFDTVMLKIPSKKY